MTTLTCEEFLIGLCGGTELTRDGFNRLRVVVADRFNQLAAENVTAGNSAAATLITRFQNNLRFGVPMTPKVKNEMQPYIDHVINAIYNEEHQGHDPQQDR